MSPSHVGAAYLTLSQCVNMVPGCTIQLRMLISARVTPACVSFFVRSPSQGLANESDDDCDKGQLDHLGEE